MSPSQDRGWERSPERGKRSQTGGRWRQVQSPGRSLEPQRTELSEGVLGKEDRGPGSPGRSLSDLETLCRAGRILFLASPWSLQEIPATHSCPVRRGFAESSEMEVKEWSDYRKGKREEFQSQWGFGSADVLIPTQPPSPPSEILEPGMIKWDVKA